MIENLRPRLDHLQFSSLAGKGIMADVLRLDLLHPIVSGNKWFKMKEYLEDARAKKHSTILSFGGAYSNHIVALAAAAKEQGFRSIGIIRGEEPATLSSTLLMARELGMQLYFTTREAYRHKLVPAAVSRQHSNYYLIHEGGYGNLGAKGAQHMLDFYGSATYTHILTPVGTGTTLAGLTEAAAAHQTVMGISVMKNNPTLANSVTALLPEDKRSQFKIYHEYHCGGYARYTKELIDFMNKWFTITHIPSDFVYTGKLFLAFNDLLEQNYFTAGSKVLLIHSGGLQGNSSLPNGTLIF
ncbi:MAG TPA: pyridoxal-phosphate dependent enzyme [Chitinophagaceae bacterium]|jgi:1-aminocyclopropane-1-carboxylate deaminase|nr:pyridoxal-phosphate dependent enzyme [Chitinophagaceae bacterium]